MTKSFDKPKIVLLNVELELKAERDNAEVRISDKLDKICKSGANIVLSKLAIGDLATQYFADRGLFCAGRVEYGDMIRLQKATGGMIQTSCNDLNPTVLGTC